MNIYLAGCGAIGRGLGKTLDNHQVIGLKRSQGDFSFPIRQIDLSDPQAVKTLPCDADIIVFTVTPNRFDEDSYRRVYETILGNTIAWAKRHKKPPLFLLVSSTGVYGQQNGEWVDEDSPTEPDTFTGRWVLFGERLLQKHWEKSLIVRFSGIYGVKRTRLLHKALSDEAIQKTPPLWTNRIHERDCIAVLAFLIACYENNRRLAPLYLASDNTPVSQYDVISYIRQQAGKTPAPIKSDNLSQRCNKRCDNARLTALGYRFRYPDYKSGYAELAKNCGCIN